MRLTCAIVEDDLISLGLLERLIEKTGILDIKNSFTSPTQAVQWFMRNEVDLLFLDVEMPDISGIELLQALPFKPEVIIVSAESNYAADAYALSVTDYLVKPIKDYGRFLNAVNKVIQKKKQIEQQQPENLFIRIDSLLLNLDIDTVLLVEASGDYIKIHTTAKVYTVYSTLKKIEEKLPSKKFVRVHRSYIVNITKIANIDVNNLEINKKIIPISATYKEDLLNKISVL